MWTELGEHSLCHPPTFDFVLSPLSFQMCSGNFSKWRKQRGKGIIYEQNDRNRHHTIALIFNFCRDLGWGGVKDAISEKFLVSLNHLGHFRGKKSFGYLIGSKLQMHISHIPTKVFPIHRKWGKCQQT